jgi:hypothetical protein
MALTNQQRDLGVRVEPVSPSVTSPSQRVTAPTIPTTTVVGRAAACSGGLPPRVGEATVDELIRFASLPSGWSQESVAGSLPNVVTASAPTAGSAAGGPATMTLTLYTESALTSGLFSSMGTQIEIQGKTGSISGQESETPTIVWRPTAGKIIELAGNRIPSTQLIEVAQHVQYKPGVTAPSVGDLGPVVPATEIANAASRRSTGTVTSLQAQLVTASEYAAAPGSGGRGNGNDPLWVVHLTGRFQSPQVIEPGPGSATVPYAAEVYDAITGDLIASAQGATPLLQGLPDHSTRQPCPSPTVATP